MIFIKFLDKKEIETIFKKYDFSNNIYSFLLNLNLEYKCYILDNFNSFDNLYFIDDEIYQNYNLYINSKIDYINSIKNHNTLKIRLENGKITINLIKSYIIKFDNKVYFKNYSEFSKITILNDNTIYFCTSRKSFKLKDIVTFYRYSRFSEDLKKYIIDNFILNNYLKKDLCKEDFYLLNLEIDKIYCFKTKHNILEYIFNEKIKFNLNKIPFFLGYSILKLKPFLLEKDVENLYKFCLEYKNHIKYDLIKLNRKGYVYNIVSPYYFYNKNLDLSEFDMSIYFNDIFKIKNEKICLSKNSVKKLSYEIENINNLRKLLKCKKKLIIPEIFIKLKLPYKFNLIKTSNQLLNEANLQNNCLWEYYNKLVMEKNNIAIYTTFIENKRYTLALALKTSKKINIVDFKGINNSNPPNYLIKEIEKTIKSFNLKIKHKI